eukprot:TRINITY_DN3207_c0_g1_i1.p1 TRINITY_DN3207_c0_g1~~TRINITY_DN3207_c0_g1_i1.p1  ORF type:complete len:341 (+),score=105.87 TRINITY_DN3207_c0_g1_i1:454-1476(+)
MRDLERYRVVYLRLCASEGKPFIKSGGKSGKDMVNTRSNRSKRKQEAIDKDSTGSDETAMKRREVEANEETSGGNETAYPDVEGNNSEPITPPLFIVHSWRVSPDDRQVNFSRRQALVSSVSEAEELRKQFKLELANDYGIELGSGGEEKEEGPSPYDGSRVEFETNVSEFISMDGVINKGPIKQRDKEEEIEEEEEEEEEKNEKELQAEKDTFYCFLWCLKQLNLQVPRDMLKVIKGMVHSSKSIVLGWWKSPFPKSVYVLRIFTLVPTYDFMPVDRLHLVVARNDKEALQISKRAFVEEVDKRRVYVQKWAASCIKNFKEESKSKRNNQKDSELVHGN